MTREERAKEYAEHNIDKYTNDFANLYNAYLKGAMEETKELEKENEKLMQMLASSADCETCKHYDEDLEKEDKEPCKNCFYDNSFWELKED